MLTFDRFAPELLISIQKGDFNRHGTNEHEVNHHIEDSAGSTCFGTSGFGYFRLQRLFYGTRAEFGE